MKSGNVIEISAKTNIALDATLMVLVMITIGILVLIALAVRG